MTSDLDLWHAFRAASTAYAAAPTPERAETLRAAHAAWVRSYCPEDAETEIAAMRRRLEARYAA